MHQLLFDLYRFLFFGISVGVSIALFIDVVRFIFGWNPNITMERMGHYILIGISIGLLVLVLKDWKILMLL